MKRGTVPRPAPGQRTRSSRRSTEASRLRSRKHKVQSRKLRARGLVVLAVVLAAHTTVGAQGRGGAAAPPQTAKAAALIDLTGYWVSVVTEDWRYRMVTPARGDYQGVPMTPEARAIADAWDPAKE